MTTAEKQADIELMLSALRKRSGNAELDRFTRYSVLASVADDESMIAAAIAEVGPEQAELDIHLSGSSVDNHSAKAEPFGVFVARTAEAVKEMAKSKLGRKRYSADLLISATTPGSLRVVLSSPDRGSKHDVALADTSVSNVESDALRTIAILMAQAGAPDGQAEAVYATIEQLPPAARERVRSAVFQVARAGWSIQGELRQRGVGIVKIDLPNDQAAHLQDQLAASETTIDRGVELVGSIDGTRRFTGTMWFQPSRSEKPFVASVTDAKLLERVNEINALPGSIVKATFDRYAVRRAGSDKSRTRTTYSLTSVEVIAHEQVSLI